MVSILYTIIENRIDEATLNAALLLLSDRDVIKIKRYQRWEDAALSLTGKLLVMKSLEKYASPEANLKCMKYDENNKPFIKGAPYFNISHSGNIVTCAMSDNLLVGIDLEKQQPINIVDFQSQYSDVEWKSIKHSENPQRVFYEYWTKKEAVIKADGRGFKIPLESLNAMGETMLVNGKLWSLMKVELQEAYICHLAVENVVEKVLINSVRQDLLYKKFETSYSSSSY